MDERPPAELMRAGLEYEEEKRKLTSTEPRSWWRAFFFGS